MIGTSDAWQLVHLYKQTSVQVYQIIDYRRFYKFYIGSKGTTVTITTQTTVNKTTVTPTTITANTTDPCPSGYVLNPGTHSGTGQLGYHKKMGSIDDCLQLCEMEEYCCAFEYSDSKKRCYLNVDCNPTKGVHKDYQFCMKEAGKYIKSFKVLYLCNCVLLSKC